MKGINRRLAKKPDEIRLLEAGGILAFYLKDYKSSKKSLEKLKRRNTSTTRMLAFACFKLKEYKQAAVYFNKISRRKIELGDWEMHGKALAKSGQKKAAMREYEALLKKHPKSEKALSYLIKYYRNPLKKKQLLPKLVMYQKLHPKDSKILLELAGLYSKKSPKAIKYLQEYMKLNPKDRKSELELAELYEAQGRKNEVISIYLKQAEEHSKDAEFNSILAGKLLASGKKKEAIKYYEIAHKLKPSDIQVLVILSGLYEELKQNGKAMKACSKALKLKPKDEELMQKYLNFAGALKSQKKKKLRERITG